MQTTAFEVHVLKQGKWQVLRAFASSDRAAAQSFYQSLGERAGIRGKKLIEEKQKANGLLTSETLSMRVFEPIAESGARPGRTDGPAARGRPVRPATAPRAAPEKRSVLATLLDFFRVHGGARTAAGNPFRAAKADRLVAFGRPAAVAARNRALSPDGLAYLTRYDDEAGVPGAELVCRESQEFLGSHFFRYVADNLIDGATAASPKFHIGICCFAVGGLMRIEARVDLASARGRALLADTLAIFLVGSELADAFVGRMAAFLAQPASTRFVKAGARCFALYEAADLDGLRSLFLETFVARQASAAALGEARRIGVVLTELVPARALDAAEEQALVDHHEAIVARYLGRCGARPVKHLGSGLMVAVGEPGRMVELMHLLCWHYANIAMPPALAAHRLRLAGHFGEAVEKSGDILGRTVETAAAMLAAAVPGQGSVAAALRDELELHDLEVVGERAVRLGGGELAVLQFV